MCLTDLFFTIEMSYDHKPEDEPERQRINKAGGRVTQDGRVNGGNYWFWVVSMGESAQLAPSSSFYVVASAILGCKSFKISGNFWIILLISYKSKDLKSFLD